MTSKPDAASALYKAASPPRRRAGLRAIAFLGVSLVAAVVSALLLTRYMDARTAASRVPTRKVVVAEVDLPVAAEIRGENVTALDWPAASVPEGAFEDPKQLVGKVISTRVFRREPIILAKLTDGGKGGLSALLPTGMRAAAVRVDDVVGVAGFVQPGDRVDVIVTLRAEGGHMTTASKVILQNVPVLAVGKELDTKGKGEKVVPATVATLMVDAEQSERLALAATQGKILLTLRSAADAEVVATSGINAAALLSLPPSPEPTKPAPRHAARAPKPPPPEKPRGEVVEILRGDTFEKRKFEGAHP